MNSQKYYSHVFSLMFLFTSSNRLITGLDTLRIQDTPINNNGSNYFIRDFIICLLIEFSILKSLIHGYRLLITSGLVFGE